ncbi:hypothetical protein Tco_1525544 [Tanacetum coccineum]
MSKTGEQGQEGEQDDGEGEVKWKLQVPRRDVVNFYFTNFPSDWNKVNLHDLFAKVGEIANVYVAKKVSKTGHKFRHVEKGTKIDTKEVNNVFGSFDGRSGENSSPIQTELYSFNVATDVAFPTSAPVLDVRDLNFDYDVRTSDVTGSCSEEKDKSISKADMYCEGLDKVELDSSGLPTWIRKLRSLIQLQRIIVMGIHQEAAFYEFIKEDSEYSNEDDDSQEDYGFDQNSRSQRRLSAQF